MGRGSFLDKEVGVVCKRACCDFHSGMHLEEEVVNQSGKSKHWCEASVCVLASVLYRDSSVLGCECGL